MSYTELGGRSWNAFRVRVCLQDQALLVRLVGLAREESRAGGVLEHLPDTLAGPSRALEILVGANLLSNLLTLNVPRVLAISPHRGHGSRHLATSRFTSA